MPKELPAPVEDDDEEGEADLEAELGVIYREATEARDRLRSLASNIQNTEVAMLCREMSGTVLTLLADLAGTVGEAVLQADEDITRLYARVDGAPTESVLLPEDAGMYLAYLEQVEKLLDALIGAAPEGPEREPLEALRRMTADRIAFTKEITADETEEDEEGAEAEAGDGEADDEGEE